jgi:UDP:flavonoid glycosyltransferase YjiC (YdhE family)
VALLGGGSLLVQALALGTPTLALPLQAEQAARVQWLARAGAVLTAPGSAPDVLADALLRLQSDEASRAELRVQAAALGLSNGLPAAVDALAALAGLGTDRPVPNSSGARA